jgi:hypothetical protein
MGLGRLKNLQTMDPVRRYQWAKPGDMINIDTKQLSRFAPVDHSITGDRRPHSLSAALTAAVP